MKQKMERGDRVMWVAFGMLAQMEGVENTIVTGTILYIDVKGRAVIEADYRVNPANNKILGGNPVIELEKLAFEDDELYLEIDDDYIEPITPDDCV